MCHSPWSQLPLQNFLHLFLGVLLGPFLSDHLRTGCRVLRSRSAQTPFFHVYFAALLARLQTRFHAQDCVMLKGTFGTTLLTGHV